MRVIEPAANLAGVARLRPVAQWIAHAEVVVAARRPGDGQVSSPQAFPAAGAPLPESHQQNDAVRADGMISHDVERRVFDKRYIIIGGQTVRGDVGANTCGQGGRLSASVSITGCDSIRVGIRRHVGD